MLSVEEVRSAVCAGIESFPHPAAGQLRFLITAGPTYEDLDAVRFIGNRSTGRMGFAVASAALQSGHQVLLVAGPTKLEAPAEASTIAVRSACEMEAAVLAALYWCDVLVMSAAVADYRPVEYTEGKIHKSNEDLMLRLVRTPDILQSVQREQTKQVIIGFSLEAALDQTAAIAKREAKGMDIIVANTTDAFGEGDTDAVVLERGLDAVKPGSSKDELACYLVERGAKLAENSN